VARRSLVGTNGAHRTVSENPTTQHNTRSRVPALVREPQWWQHQGACRWTGRRVRKRSL